MAALTADGAPDDLVHLADHGANYPRIVYADRIVEQAELAMLEYVWWRSYQRFGARLGSHTSLEVKQA